MAVWPNSVRLYSTFGGTTGYTFRVINPWSSSSFIWMFKSRREASGILRCSSLGRLCPSLINHSRRNFRLPYSTSPMRSRPQFRFGKLFLHQSKLRLCSNLCNRGKICPYSIHISVLVRTDCMTEIFKKNTL